MTAQEVPVSTQSANSRRNWRPLAIFALLALYACDTGRTTDKSSAAQRQIFPGNSSSVASQPQGPREVPVLVDCNRNPKAMGAVAAVEDPGRVGDTYILGTYDRAAALKPDGQIAVVEGLRVVQEGSRRYSVSSVNESGANPLEVVDFNGDNSERVAEFALTSARVTIESVAMPGNYTIAGFVATIVCAQAARS